MQRFSDRRAWVRAVVVAAAISVGLNGLVNMIEPASAEAADALPGAPTAVVALAGDSTAFVSWTAPGDVGDGIVAYTVTALSGTTTVGSRQVVGAQLGQTIVGLVNGVSYRSRPPRALRQALGPHRTRHCR